MTAGHTHAPVADPPLAREAVDGLTTVFTTCIVIVNPTIPATEAPARRSTAC